MDLFIIHSLNSLLYASVLFLIAGGLSLIYGVMRFVNLAHGNLFALGAFIPASAVGQWFAGSTSVWLYLLLPLGALGAAAIGAILEPTLLRPFYRRPEEYQLLVTFGILMILEDVMRFVWGPYPVSATTLFEQMGRMTIGDWIYPRYNLLVIAIGGLAAIFLWAFICRTNFGILLPAPSPDIPPASAPGVNVNLVSVPAFTLRCFLC